MAIVLDAMGSDNYPLPEIQASVQAAELIGDEIILVGNQELLKPKLQTINTRHLPIRILHAPEIVEMGDKVVESSLKKPRNSMSMGLDLVKNGQASAFVTAGNTGAAMFNALRRLGRLNGVQRPALTTLFPLINGNCVILDIGANADCRPEFLQQFAIMGCVYAEKVLNIENPRIGLLSNGEEAGKGNQLTKDTFHLLSVSGLNFIGNLEPKDMLAGHADVVVTDGFTGNILIKTSESVAKLITDLLRQELTSSLQTKIGALLAKPAFNRIKNKMDPSEIGAAPLLGINGLVFVGHGRSDAHALTSAIRVAYDAIQVNLLEALRYAIQERISKINSMKSPKEKIA